MICIKSLQMAALSERGKIKKINVLHEKQCYTRNCSVSYISNHICTFLKGDIVSSMWLCALVVDTMDHDGKVPVCILQTRWNGLLKLDTLYPPHSFGFRLFSL